MESKIVNAVKYTFPALVKNGLYYALDGETRVYNRWYNKWTQGRGMYSEENYLTPEEKLYNAKQSIKIQIPELVKEYVRSLPTDPDKEIFITKRDDLVYVDRYVPIHVDNDGKDPSKDVLLLCLVNDCPYQVWTDENGWFQINPGDVIRFNGAAPHALSGNYCSDNRFAAIIWDVDKNRGSESFRNELQDRIVELYKDASVWKLEESVMKTTMGPIQGNRDVDIYLLGYSDGVKEREKILDAIGKIYNHDRV